MIRMQTFGIKLIDLFKIKFKKIKKMWPIAEPPLAFIMKNVGGGFLNEGKETISPQRLRVIVIFA